MKPNQVKTLFGKLTPEHIDALATQLAKSNAPLPNLEALNPALHAMQVHGAAALNPQLQVPGVAKPSTKPPAPMAPPKPEIKPAGASMEQEGQAQGLVTNDPVRARNPFLAFNGA